MIFFKIESAKRILIENSIVIDPLIDEESIFLREHQRQTCQIKRFFCIPFR